MRFDMKNFMSFQSTSINFSSNNPRIILPGIQKQKQEQIYEPDVSFDPLVFKSGLNYFFFIEHNGHTIKEYQIDNGVVKIVDNSLETKMNEKRDKSCLDIVLDGESMMYVLCVPNRSRRNTIDSTYEYTILAVDYFKHSLIWETHFSSYYMIKPKIKLLTAMNPDKKNSESQNVSFIIFNKSSDSNLDRHEKIVLVHVTVPNEETPVVQNEMKEILITKLLNLNEVSVDNLYISSSPDHALFLLIKSEIESKVVQSVYKCSIISDKEFSSYAFDSCSALYTNINNFFLKQSNYIYIDLSNSMVFCSLKTGNCKTGKIQKDWRIEQILLEDNTAVVIMTIKNIVITFINDFKENTFTWHYDTSVLPKSAFLISSFEDGKYFQKLISFYEKGYSISGVSISKILEIKASDIEKLEKIELRLDNEKIMDLDVRIYRNNIVYNSFENKQVIIIKTDENLFKLKLGFSGSKLVFEPGLNQEIYYYNTLEHNLSLPNTDEVRFFSNKKYLFKIKSESIDVLMCSYLVLDLQVKCRFVIGVTIPKIDLKNLKKVERVGDLAFFLFNTGNNFVVIDILSRQVIKVKTPPEFEGGTNCKIYTSRIYCQYAGSTERSDYLRVFEITSISETEIELIEYKQLEKAISEFSKESFGSLMQNQKITEIVIEDFGTDSVRSEHLIIFFKFIYGGTFLNKLYEFKLDFQDSDQEIKVKYLKQLSENSDIKKDSTMLVMDSQIVFISFDPAFKMFCYELDNYFKFDFLDAEKIVKKVTLPSHNLIGFIYLSRGDEKYYFALFKVTADASKQFIKQKQIIDYSPSFDILLYEIDPYTVGILEYDYSKEQIHLSVYFDEGPILIASSLKDPITVNQNKYLLDAIEDKTFNLVSINYIKNPHINLSSLKDSNDVNLDEYLHFVGNLHHIEAKEDSLVQIENPIQLDKETILDEHMSSYDVIAHSFENRFGYKNSNNKFVIKSLIPEQSISDFDFDGVKDNNCSELVVSYASIFCFYKNGPEHKLAVKSYADFANTKHYLLARQGERAKIITDGNYLMLASVHTDHKFITIYAFDKLGKHKPHIQYIGRKKLLTDTIKVTDYHIGIDSDLTSMTTLIFDKVTNLIHVITMTFDDKYKLKKIPILRKNFKLDKIGFFFRKMTCVDIDNNISNTIFECNLYGDAQIALIQISKVTKTTNSEFSWKLEILRTFKNLLYKNSFHNKFKVFDSMSKEYTAISSRIYNKGNEEVILYDLKRDSQYSFGVLTLQPNTKLLKMVLDGKELKLAILIGEKLIIQNYLIKGYTMKLKEKSSLVGKQVEMNAIFDNGSRHAIKFSFSEDQGAIVKEEEKMNVWLIMLIVGVAVIALLIMLAIVAIVMLLLEKKKWTNQLNES